MPEEIDWNSKATIILKEKLARKKMKYHDLARALNDIGINENQNTIATKLSRGSFSFAFFLQCMTAMKIDYVEFVLDIEN